MTEEIQEHGASPPPPPPAPSSSLPPWLSTGLQIFGISSMLAAALLGCPIDLALGMNNVLFNPFEENDTLIQKWARYRSIPTADRDIVMQDMLRSGNKPPFADFRDFSVSDVSADFLKLWLSWFGIAVSGGRAELEKKTREVLGRGGGGGDKSKNNRIGNAKKYYSWDRVVQLFQKRLAATSLVKKFVQLCSMLSPAEEEFLTRESARLAAGEGPGPGPQVPQSAAEKDKSAAEKDKSSSSSTAEQDNSTISAGKRRLLLETGFLVTPLVVNIIISDKKTKSGVDKFLSKIVPIVGSAGFVRAAKHFGVEDADSYKHLARAALVDIQSGDVFPSRTAEYLLDKWLSEI